MGFSVISKNLSGFNADSLLGPLSSLASNSNPDNLIFPSDLGSNPAMGHAVVFQVYNRTSALKSSAENLVSITKPAVNSILSATQSGGILSGINQALSSLLSGNTLSGVGSSVLDTGLNLIQAPSYSPLREGSPLSTISMFMPESLNVNYSSNYGEVSMTEALGVAGIIGNAISDVNKQGLKDAVVPYAIGMGSKAFGAIAGSRINRGSAAAGEALSQALGIVENPQMQLMYRGINLREFQLEFIMTPRSPGEAKTVKNICDAFTYYSLPGLAGGPDSSGQYLTPPQLFSVQFRFLGKNDIVGNISNVISSALTNVGLGFFTSRADVSNAGTSAKLFTVLDCVLENVSIDYTPNGFATYNDGYPVQTRLNLTFKETQMLTKQNFNKSKISDTYSSSTFESERIANNDALGDWNDSTGNLEEIYDIQP